MYRRKKTTFSFFFYDKVFLPPKKSKPTQKLNDLLVNFQLISLFFVVIKYPSL